MALIAAYGMDVYANLTDFLAQQEWVNDNSDASLSYTNIGTTTGRFGGGSFNLPGNTSDLSAAILLLPNQYKTLFFFVAFRVAEINHDTNCIEFNANGTIHTTFRVESATDSLQITRGGTGTVVYDEAITENVYHTIEMKIVVDAAAGELIINLDNIEIVNLTGVDTANGANEYVNQIRFLSNSPGSLNMELRIDDIVVWDETGATNNDFLGDMKIHTLRPNAAGDVTGFTPSAGDNWEAVNDSPGPNDDTDYVEVSSTGTQDLYNVEDLGPTGNILGTVVKVYDRKLDAGSRNIRLLTKSGTTIGTGAILPVLTTWTYQQEIFELNPDTAALWTTAEINSVQIGMENA